MAECDLLDVLKSEEIIAKVTKINFYEKDAGALVARKAASVVNSFRRKLFFPT